jgi:hypothetical protein
MVNCTTASALGYAYEGTQEGKKAVEQLIEAYQLCPTQTELLYAIGNICMGQLRDNDCALEYYQKYTASKKQLAKDHPVHMLIDSIKQMKAAEAAGPETAPEGTPEPISPGTNDETAPAGADDSAGKGIEVQGSTASKPESRRPSRTAKGVIS